MFVIKEYRRHIFLAIVSVLTTKFPSYYEWRELLVTVDCFCGVPSIVLFISDSRSRPSCYVIYRIAALIWMGCLHCAVTGAVEVSIKSRKVIVKGPRGTLRRDFRHMNVDIKKISKKQILVEKWFGIRKELAAVKTICSHIENMMKGVTKVSILLSSLAFSTGNAK